MQEVRRQEYRVPQVQSQARTEVRENVKQGTSTTEHRVTGTVTGEPRVLSVRVLKGTVRNSDSGSGLGSRQGSMTNITKTKTEGEWELKDGKFIRRDSIIVDKAGLEVKELEQSRSFREGLFDKAGSDSGSVTRKTVRTEGEWELKDGKFIRRDTLTNIVTNNPSGSVDRRGSIGSQRSSLLGEASRAGAVAGTVTDTVKEEGDWELRDGKFYKKTSTTIRRQSVTKADADNYGGYAFPESTKSASLIRQL